MAYHTKDKPKTLNPKRPTKKPTPKTNLEAAKMRKFEGLTDAQIKKLREHSKSHPGGFRSIHMRNMVKFMKQGDSFNKSHEKAVKIDKERMKR